MDRIIKALRVSSWSGAEDMGVRRAPGENGPRPTETPGILTFKGLAAGEQLSKETEKK